MYKIVVFVPADKTDELIEAMANAGAGNIGNYSHNAYITHGFGNWMSKKGANPTIGMVGKISREAENKVEMVCPKNRLNKVIAEVRNIHPYEEPAIDVYRLEKL